MASPTQEFQAALYGTLSGSSDLAAMVGTRIHDGVPPDEVFPRITFGPVSYVPQQIDCADVWQVTRQIDVWSRRNGELYEAQAIVDKVVEVVNSAKLSLATHAAAGCEVTLVRVFRDPDGLTAHGVVQVEAMVERR